MTRFKVLMAFPMFATVVWLVWVIGQQTGIDGAAALLATLLALAFIAWAPGIAGTCRVRRGRRGQSGAGAVVDAAGVPGRGLPAARTGEAGPHWQPWSEQRVAELRAAGKPVFVDFTAAWCVTCQYNKRSTLPTPR